MRFKKDQAEVQALINSGSEANAMAPAYAAKLGLKVWPTDVGAQKIDGSTLETFGMVLVNFQVEDKLGRAWFFQETFLVANVSVEVVLGMLFFTLSNADVVFKDRELIWKSYTPTEALLTTKRVLMIGRKELVAAALDPDKEAFVVHVASLSLGAKMSVHPAREVQIALLVAEEVTTLAEYSDFADAFSKESAAELHERSDINENAINLELGKQPPYGPIYSLGPVELETLKTYIKTNLVNGFIRHSKSPAGTSILFVRKTDGSLRFCVDYRGLNNLTIKNRYPLPLIGESLNRLGRAKRFTQLDLTNAYYRMRIKEGDEWKTAFRTRYGHFEYKVMLFGLSNAPASFHGYINKIVAEKLDVFVIVYLDDIFVYTDDPGQAYVDALRLILDILRKNSLFANLKKCRFHKDEVRFLSYTVSAHGVRMEDKRIEAVKNWPEPKSVRDIPVFLGYANFYFRFIRGFSKIAGPLTSILRTANSSKNSLTSVGVAEGDEVVSGGESAGANKNLSQSQKSKKSKKSAKNPTKMTKS